MRGKLAELLRGNHLKPVYHGEQGLRTLKELARSYLTISKDVTRVMNRLKALYRSWGIACAGIQVSAPRHRSEWLGRISEAGVRRRAEHCYEQLDVLRLLRQQVRWDLLLESKKHQAWRLLGLIPGIGPIRAALLIALIQTPYRFRTKRQLWTYSGLGLETHDSAQYRVVEGQLRSKKSVTLRGLNQNHNHDLKDIFKGAATHLVFALVTTAYIFIAIQLEERDLMKVHPEYAQYREQVPMLVPGLGRPCGDSPRPRRQSRHRLRRIDRANALIELDLESCCLRNAHLVIHFWIVGNSETILPNYDPNSASKCMKNVRTLS
jgi:hypothetical protein